MQSTHSTTLQSFRQRSKHKKGNSSQTNKKRIFICRAEDPFHFDADPD